MRYPEIIVRISSIAKSCLDVFIKYCSNGNFLAISSIPNDDLVFKISGGLESFALSREERIRVVNLFDEYWISFSLVFGITETSTKRYEYYIHEIFIKVYHGVNSEINKKILFRAEWSSNDPGPFEHAQPHWHFHHHEVLLLTKSDSFDAYLELKEEEKDLVDVLEENKGNGYDISNIHFAMSNDWQKGNSNSHMIKIDENNITQWLDGLLNHITKQLMYSSKKSSIL